MTGLVERLRDRIGGEYSQVLQELLAEAADRIEQLETQLAELNNDFDILRASLKGSKP